VSEWWTYRPADLLMFAPRTYWRLFELHNEALWPAQALTALAALIMAGGLWQRRVSAVRAGLALLAACWALVAWTFFWQRYAPINAAAGAFAIAFAVQAGGLLALVPALDARTSSLTGPRWAGLALLGWALVAHPCLASISGRPWSQAEFFGLAPDPTAIGTLGVLLLVSSQRRWVRFLLTVLWFLALSWCAVSAATLWTMGSSQGWVSAAGAVLALAMKLRRRA
jgi:hypothetical protein